MRVRAVRAVRVPPLAPASVARSRRAAIRRARLPARAPPTPRVFSFEGEAASEDVLESSADRGEPSTTTTTTTTTMKTTTAPRAARSSSAAHAGTRAVEERPGAPPTPSARYPTVTAVDYERVPPNATRLPPPDLHGHDSPRFEEVRSIHWSPYDRVRVVNAVP